MDKKTKERIDLLNKRLQKLRQQLSGAKKQMDEPGEAERLEAEIGEQDGQCTLTARDSQHEYVYVETEED